MLPSMIMLIHYRRDDLGDHWSGTVEIHPRGPQGYQRELCLCPPYKVHGFLHGRAVFCRLMTDSCRLATRFSRLQLVRHSSQEQTSLGPISECPRPPCLTAYRGETHLPRLAPHPRPNRTVQGPHCSSDRHGEQP
jgi:hypothetical protein